MLDLSSTISNINGPIPFDEKVRDHDSIIDAYLDSHALQTHSQRTIAFDQWYLKGWFTGFKVKDDHHPEGRQLFVWEAMHPYAGREIISNYANGLAQTDLLRQTCVAYIGRLHCAFDYVVGRSYIPAATVHLDSPVMIAAKYNAIANPVSKYDYPPQNAEERFADPPLVDDRLIDFLSWVHADFLPKARNQETAARTYAQIVPAAEAGLRYVEIEGLDALQPTRDLDYQRGCIRIRSGKASRGSGKRPREIEMTPFLQATLEHFEGAIRTGFRRAEVNPALFLSLTTGERLGYGGAWKDLRVIITEARREGLILPSDMGWHSLRRSFATQYLDRHPDQIWRLLEIMGHQSLLSLIRYIRPSQEAVEQAVNSIVADLTGVGAI